jgi:hypothetical protein
MMFALWVKTSRIATKIEKITMVIDSQRYTRIIHRGKER